MRRRSHRLLRCAADCAALVIAAAAAVPATKTRKPRQPLLWRSRPCGGRRLRAGARNTPGRRRSGRRGEVPGAGERLPGLLRPAREPGVIRARRGELEPATALLQRAVAVCASCAAPWTELGLIQRQQGRFADAEQSYLKAIAADPGYANALLQPRRSLRAVPAAPGTGARAIRTLPASCRPGIPPPATSTSGSRTSPGARRRSSGSAQVEDVR